MKEYEDTMRKLNFNVIQTIKTETICAAKIGESQLLLVHSNAQPDGKIYITVKGSLQGFVDTFLGQFKTEYAKQDLFSGS